MKVFALVMVLALTGCSSRPPSADLGTAKAALTTSLDAWRSGQSLVSLQNQEPPIFVVEDQWLADTALKDFTVAEQAEVVGSSVRFEVELVFSRTKETACYVVTTDPALTIARLE